MADVATETVVGSHVLTIDAYTKTTAALAVGESIQSQEFRVGGQGWMIVCFPRGEDDANANWVSVSLWISHHRGSHEVKATAKFVLLDGSGGEILSSYASSEPETFSVMHGRAAWGTPQFIRRETLESYLVIQDDDRLRIRCDVAVIKEPREVPDLHRSHLGDLLLASDVARDVTFLVGGERFTAHSCVLAARSSTVFMAEVLGTGKEKEEEKEEEMEEVLGTGKEGAAVVAGSRPVQVDGMPPRVFEALLHFIYTDSVPDGGIAYDLLEAAGRYGMERLKMICSDVLCSNIDATTVLHTLKLSTRHRCLKLNQSCVKFIRGMLDALSLEKTE